MERSLQALAPWQVPTDLIGVFTDIDDTLTTEGAVTADALAALGALKAAGLHVIPITGRPVGWSERFAAAWPVDAIVAENGAVALRLEPQRISDEIGLQRLSDKRRQLSKIYQQDAATRAANFTAMHAVLEQIEREVPQARRAQDSAGRETDIAIDHSEFTHLPQPAIDACVATMRAAGMSASVSSIHINGWFGAHNKWEGARWIVRELFGRELADERSRWVYVGDSTNDQIMFEHFEHSVGVANIARFVPQLAHLPRFVTKGERGAGFAELARHLLAATPT
ncbi:MAG: HAD-IIB family hydrolase [Giesbergeria sp.]|jgi:HAD superfamily hydrolase (TIGR01484 family)|nr:HAD-IIB family hydrolase [Giesbergeria sp.]MBP6158632.1 HAD-IIB family hydrolase [Giesbergeria sp.]MBP7082854.1 HAD-IIB family hydrolase [Giesbergeria sp.]MBP9783019.1 HAD-IIB family hydrolase [Giesbergeria sp.]MBP9895062.1 HAD-IIB family hydrolase [Giesbergeria sp.]